MESARAMALCAPFLLIELGFLVANSTKIVEGVGCLWQSAGSSSS
jgi:hypothetical protein